MEGLVNRIKQTTQTIIDIPEVSTRMHKQVPTYKMCTYCSMNEQYKQGFQNNKSLQFSGLTKWALYFCAEARDNIIHWVMRQSFYCSSNWDKKACLNCSKNRNKKSMSLSFKEWRPKRLRWIMRLTHNYQQICHHL